jgi:type II secretory pathway pseudopilin PulG
MLQNSEDVVREIKVRAIAHRIDAETARRLERGLKIPATFVSAIIATLSIIQTFAKTEVVLYVTAAVSCIGFILNGVLASFQTAEKYQKHEEASKNYERLYNRCIAEYFKQPHADEVDELVKQIEIDASIIVLNSPLISSSAEHKARLQSKNDICSCPRPANRVSSPAVITEPTSPVSSSEPENAH